jgi:hypothetical protein
MQPEWIEALIDGDAAFTERFGIAVIEGWAGFPEALPHALDTARCGFARTGTIADPDPDPGVDEDVWRWELQLR